PAPTPTPAPEPVAEVAPAPAPSAQKPLSLGSMPTGAAVYLDGRQVGTTPMLGFLVSYGDHTLKMVQDGATLCEEPINVGDRTANRYIFKDGKLEAHH
ncbi:MAG: PEGA domain-containing protein, partial [Deltaproteobacteria bacterium]